MLRYSRHIHIEAEGPDVKITGTNHYRTPASLKCESSILYQHVMLGAQNEFQNWLKQQTEGLLAAPQTRGAYVRLKINGVAARWTKDLSTEILLLLAADDHSLTEYRGDWPEGEPVREILRSSLKADILITLSILWADTCRELLSKTDE